jgi:hypothetical protein
MNVFSGIQRAFYANTGSGMDVSRGGKIVVRMDLGLRGNLSVDQERSWKFYMDIQVGRDVSIDFKAFIGFPKSGEGGVDKK